MVNKLKMCIIPDYALGIVMRVESSIKQTLFQQKHSNRYDEGEKVAKRCVLKRFQHVIDFLMHNLGLTNLNLHKLTHFYSTINCKKRINFNKIHLEIYY